MGEMYHLTSHYTEHSSLSAFRTLGLSHSTAGGAITAKLGGVGFMLHSDVTGQCHLSRGCSDMNSD